MPTKRGDQMPSSTPKQRAFFGAELGRKRAGLATKTKLPEGTLKEFAMKVKKPPAKPPKAKPIFGHLGDKA
jgi:hypothetical protein